MNLRPWTVTILSLAAVFAFVLTPSTSKAYKAEGETEALNTCFALLSSRPQVEQSDVLMDLLKEDGVVNEWPSSAFFGGTGVEDLITVASFRPKYGSRFETKAQWWDAMRVVGSRVYNHVATAVLNPEAAKAYILTGADAGKFVASLETQTDAAQFSAKIPVLLRKPVATVRQIWTSVAGVSPERGRSGSRLVEGLIKAESAARSRNQQYEQAPSNSIVAYFAEHVTESGKTRLVDIIVRSIPRPDIPGYFQSQIIILVTPKR